MKMKAKTKPTTAGYYLISVEGGLKTYVPMLMYYDEGRYTFGHPKDITNEEKSIPITDLIEPGFWRFFGPITPVEVTA